MTKTRSVCFFILLIALYSSQCLYACSSFAGYSETKLYGMNFDVPDTELRFSIKKVPVGKLFLFEFKNGNRYDSPAKMNSKGMFVGTNLQYSGKIGYKTNGYNEVYIGDLDMLLKKYDTVGNIKEYLTKKKLFVYSTAVHKIFADLSGDAMIVETGETNNNIIPIKDNFIVMTNFCNSDFVDKPYHEVRGIGAYRYITAFEYLKDNLNKLNVDSGLEILGKVCQYDGHLKTQCSMVFDPLNQNIYFAIRGNFEKIWRLSLEKETIESYRGFEKPIEISVKSKGVLASKLLSYQ